LGVVVVGMGIGCSVPYLLCRQNSMRYNCQQKNNDAVHEIIFLV